MPRQSSKHRKQASPTTETTSYANLLSGDYSPPHQALSPSPRKTNTLASKKTQQLPQKKAAPTLSSRSSTTTSTMSTRSPSSSLSSSLGTSNTSSLNTSTSTMSSTSNSDDETGRRRSAASSKTRKSSGSAKRKSKVTIQASKAPPSRQQREKARQQQQQQKKQQEKREPFHSTIPMDLKVAPKRSAAEITRALQRLESIVFFDKEEITVDADAEFQSILLSHIRLLETKKQRTALKAEKEKETHQYRAQILHERLYRLRNEEETERDQVYRFERQHLESIIRTLEKDIKEDVEAVAAQETLREKYWNRTLSMVTRAEVTNRKQLVFAEGHTRIQISQQFEREVSAHLMKLRKMEVNQAKKKQAAKVQQWERSYRSSNKLKESALLEKSGISSGPSFRRASTTNNAAKKVTASSFNDNNDDECRQSIDDILSDIDAHQSTTSPPTPDTGSPSKQAATPPPSDLPKDNDDDNDKKTPGTTTDTSGISDISSPHEEPSPQRPSSSVPSTGRGAQQQQQQQNKKTTDAETANQQKKKKPLTFTSATSHLQRFSEEENENIRHALINLELDRREELELEEEGCRNSLITTLSHNLVAVVSRLEKEGKQAIERSKHQLQRHVIDLDVMELDKRSKIESEEEAAFKHILRKYERAAAIEWKKYDENIVRHVAHEKKLVDRQRRIDARRAAATERVEMNRKLLQITDPSAVKVSSTSLYSVYFNSNKNNNNSKSRNKSTSPSNNATDEHQQDTVGGLAVFEGLSSMKPKPPTTAPPAHTARFLPSIHQKRNNHNNNNNSDDDDDSSNDDDDDDEHQDITSERNLHQKTHPGGGRKRVIVDPYSASFLRKREEGFSTAFNGDSTSMMSMRGAAANGGAQTARRAGTGVGGAPLLLPALVTRSNPSSFELEERKRKQQLAETEVRIRHLLIKERKKREEIVKEQKFDQFHISQFVNEKEDIDERLFKAKFKRELADEDRYWRAEEKVQNDDLRGQFMAAFLDREKALAQRVKDTEAHERHQRLELVNKWKDDFNEVSFEKNEILRTFKLGVALKNEEAYWRRQLELEAGRQLKAVRDSIRTKMSGNRNDAKSFAQPTHHQKDNNNKKSDTKKNNEKTTTTKKAKK